jgi:hypothetical protein
LKRKLDHGDYYGPVKERTEFENRLKKLLASRLDDNHKELVSFQKRTLKYKDYILTFLYYPNVHPDNNGSEHAIRSITDTTLKNKQHVLMA